LIHLYTCESEISLPLAAKGKSLLQSGYGLAKGGISTSETIVYMDPKYPMNLTVISFGLEIWKYK
jgi:hypothetical protein